MHLPRGQPPRTNSSFAARVAEEAFDLDIPDEDAEKIATVKDAVTYIESKKK